MDMTKAVTLPMTYRVREPFLAVKDEAPSQFSFVTIAPGSTITITGDVKHSGLVDVLYKGEILAAFMRDIMLRADLMERAQANHAGA